MILASFTVLNAMRSGLETGVLTVPSVIRLSIVMVALIVTGILLVISIRAMWKALYNGTEYGSWPGLKKWIGPKSIPSTPYQDLLAKEIELLQADLEAVKGVPDFMKGAIEEHIKWHQMIAASHSGITITKDKNVPPGKVYMLNPGQIVFNGDSLLTFQDSVKNFFYEGTNMSEIGAVGICGIFKPDMDVICFADAGHNDGNHHWVSCALIANILQEVPAAEHLEAMRELKKQVNNGLQIIQVEKFPNPPHPKLRKGGKRIPQQEVITEVLREFLEPIHMEGGETWLEVTNPQFTFDVLAQRILQRLEGYEP